MPAPAMTNRKSELREKNSHLLRATFTIARIPRSETKRFIAILPSINL